jgi:hypothetical protein
MQKLGVDFNIIEDELKRRLRKSHKQLDQLFRDYAAEHYAADYKRLKMSYIPCEDNLALQQIVAVHVKLAQDDLFNATQTKGGKVKLSLMDGSGGAKLGKGKVLPWRKFYVNVCDDVNTKVVTGAMSYNEAVREASRNLSARGVRIIPYKSGQRISLEAGIRRNVMGYLGLMAEQISEYNHDVIGANGYEISAHAMSALDHEPIQGRQVSDEEHDKMQAGLPFRDIQGNPYAGFRRRIGTLNCGHNKFSIIIGVNEPQYTPQQLAKLKEDNHKGFTYTSAQGDTVRFDTMYDVAQHMRYIERQQRKYEAVYRDSVNTLNNEQTMIASSNLVQWRQEYARFSKAVGLRRQTDRNFVVGFQETINKAKRLGFIVPRMR